MTSVTASVYAAILIVRHIGSSCRNRRDSLLVGVRPLARWDAAVLGICCQDCVRNSFIGRATSAELFGKSGVKKQFPVLGTLAAR
jgi:hypothetical protein